MRVAIYECEDLTLSTIIKNKQEEHLADVLSPHLGSWPPQRSSVKKRRTLLVLVLVLVLQPERRKRASRGEAAGDIQD